MKKFIITPIIGVLLISCGSESAENHENEVEQQDTSAVTIDTLSTDTTVAALSFEFFEDYAVIDSKTKLYESFEPSQLKDDTTWYAEGEVMRLSTTLTHDDRVVKFVWEEDDNESLSNIDASYFIWNKDYSATSTQVIPSRCGFSLGTTLKEFTEWNEAPVYFSGFGWDYAGGISQTEENKSKLLSCDTGVRLEIEYTDEMSEDYNFLYGDHELNTEMEGVLDAPIYVGYFSYYLPLEQ